MTHLLVPRYPYLKRPHASNASTVCTLVSCVHLVDRVRERTGRESEQDIELTREELVQEYLLGVKIVDRHIDEDNKVCTATAVMPRNPLQPKQVSAPDPAVPASR